MDPGADYASPLTPAATNGTGEPAVGYGRVSTRPQDKKGFGGKDQTRQVIAHITARGYSTPFGAMLIDVISGRTEQRRDLDRIRGWARAGLIKVVVVARMDRLARDEGGYLGAILE